MSRGTSSFRLPRPWSMVAGSTGLACVACCTVPLWLAGGLTVGGVTAAVGGCVDSLLPAVAVGVSVVGGSVIGGSVIGGSVIGGSVIGAAALLRRGWSGRRGSDRAAVGCRDGCSGDSSALADGSDRSLCVGSTQ